jgi:hypothetical protein
VQTKPQGPKVQRPQPEAVPPSSAAGQKPVEVAKLEEPRPQPVPIPSSRRQEAIALSFRRDDEFYGDVQHSISLSGLTVQETKAKSLLGSARILVVSGGAVHRDILNFYEANTGWALLVEGSNTAIDTMRLPKSWHKAFPSPFLSRMTILNDCTRAQKCLLSLLGNHRGLTFFSLLLLPPNGPMSFGVVVFVPHNYDLLWKIS